MMGALNRVITSQSLQLSSVQQKLLESQQMLTNMQEQMQTLKRARPADTEEGADGREESTEIGSSPSNRRPRNSPPGRSPATLPAPIASAAAAATSAAAASGATAGGNASAAAATAAAAAAAAAAAGTGSSSSAGPLAPNHASTPPDKMDAPNLWLTWSHSGGACDSWEKNKQRRAKITTTCSWMDAAATLAELRVMRARGEPGERKRIAERINHVVRQRVAFEFKERTGKIPPSLAKSKILNLTTLGEQLEKLGKLETDAFDLNLGNVDFPAFRAQLPPAPILFCRSSQLYLRSQPPIPLGYRWTMVRCRRRTPPAAAPRRPPRSQPRRAPPFSGYSGGPHSRCDVAPPASPVPRTRPSKPHQPNLASTT